MQHSTVLECCSISSSWWLSLNDASSVAARQLGWGRWVVICRLRLHKSLVYDDHSAYDLWSAERQPVKTATRKHVARPPWLLCQFSYLISYWPRSADLNLQHTLIKDSSLPSPAGLVTSGECRGSKELIHHIIFKYYIIICQFAFSFFQPFNFYDMA